MVTRREHIKRFIDTVPEEKLIEFESLIFDMIPEEDEELTEEEIKAIDEGRKQFKRGETVSLSELLEELETEGQDDV